ncbi:restriction endonuclease subunit S [Vagococcus lutrae]|uniref:restriction endonuclease subunit S n=1 Tax=Vagococcus lutrae TaxID=81947 RepID=UPI00200D6EBC|nr:restriction endonuclease subunit S [Vagococcus lutrae]UQF11732.1 restriction endonuclease subunit S [Vagococcus lutrae]
MKTINKQPKIRFKGYTDEWQQRKLGELAEIVGGGTPSTKVSEYWNGNIDWYAPAEIGSKRYLKKSEKTITELGLKKSSAKLLPIGTVLFTSRAGIGNTAILEKEGATNQGFQSIVPKNDILDTYFIYSRTKELKRYGETTGAGSTFIEVSGKEMSKMNINVPNIHEQQKIGSFFKQLDDTITLHQRKLEALEKIKKSFLQKMFPKKDETKPEIRFAGFTDDWEQRKAIKIFTSISEKKHPELPVLSASQEKGMILRDKIGIDIKYDKKSLNTYKKVSPGQFVIHLRSFQGGFAYSEIEGITSPAYTVIDFKDKELYYPLFWRFVLSSTTFIKKLETVTYGIRDGRSISFTDFSSLKFVVPGYEEQQKIGSFFKQLDDNIALHQRQLEVLKNMKTSFLQKMYI